MSKCSKEKKTTLSTNCDKRTTHLSLHNSKHLAFVLIEGGWLKVGLSLSFVTNLLTIHDYLNLSSPFCFESNANDL
ncbi:CLUMA_CG009682, isoform A [Clunio marinus]|uniref:CLUMA_CG009682, isoform A n=1 Tax=Clunio marinus TaxID=568069 RepID=A0A1J1I7L9_9DIPT|nr:CLUMA_CG009682, isoform A [Clunio marinus]